MAEKTEQKPKRTRNTKSKQVASKPEVATSEITSLESTDNKEIVVENRDEDALVLKEEVKKEEEISEEVPEIAEEVVEKEISESKEIASEVPEDAGELASGEEIPESKEEDVIIPETVIKVIEKQQKEEELPKDAKIVLKKLNPNFPDAKSKWASAIMRNTDLHIFFKGSLGKAHKRAENYCILHNLDSKDIQLIRK